MHYLSALSPSAKVMRRDIYEEYKTEHPEELEGLNRILRYSEAIEAKKQEYRNLKIAKIEMYRRLIDGDSGI